MCEKVILPIQKAIISTWPEDGFISSIIGTEKTGKDWLFNTYIQTEAYKESDNLNICRINYLPSGKYHYGVNLFDYCPLINKYCYNEKFVIDAFGSMQEFVKYAIRNNSYVSMYIDQAYRTEITEGKQGIISHPIYIYGFENNTFFTLDNYNNYKFASRNIMFSDLENGRDWIRNNKKENFYYRIYTYSISGKSYTFDLNYLKNQLYDYYTSVDSTSYNSVNKKRRLFGIECMSKLNDYITYANKIKLSLIDLRSFVFFEERQYIMKKRLNYMYNHEMISKRNKETISYITDEAISGWEECKNLLLKYNITKDNEILLRVSKKILLLRDIEKRQCEIMLEKI